MHTDTTFTAFPEIASAPRRTRSDRVMGLVVMALLPALFWTALVAMLAPLAGYAPSPATLVMIAGGIATFLASICCAVTSRSN